MLGALDAAPVADLLVLPELWDVGYFAFDDYETEAAPLTEGPVPRIADVAAARGCTIVAGSVLEQDGERLHNTAVVLTPGGVAGTYRKRHLFRYGSREGELLSPGTSASVVATPVGAIGLATCFDLRFAAHFAELRHGGADLFVVPAAWPEARAEHWRVLAHARAIEGQTPIVAVNGVGPCAGVELAGQSMIVDARGEVLADAARSVGWFTATLDPAVTLEWRNELPLDTLR